MRQKRSFERKRYIKHTRTERERERESERTYSTFKENMHPRTISHNLVDNFNFWLNHTPVKFIYSQTFVDHSVEETLKGLLGPSCESRVLQFPSHDHYTHQTLLYQVKRKKGLYYVSISFTYTRQALTYAHMQIYKSAQQQLLLLLH